VTQTGDVAESRLSDWISLGVLASWVPRDEIEDAVEAAGKTAQRKGGKLPPQVNTERLGQEAAGVSYPNCLRLEFRDRRVSLSIRNLALRVPE
jgi:hypothetical protein